jgi:DNA-binding MarR family transcriptional regulator
MSRNKMTTKHMWTKQEIKEVIKLWESSNLNDISEHLNLTISQVQSMAKQIRKAGFNLPKKSKVSTAQKMVKEVLSEMNLI